MGATSMTKPYAVLLLACLVLLGACSRDEPPAAQAPANESADTALGKVAEKVRTKLEHENITLSSSDAEAKAEITPQGDLLIGGKEVATDEAQRALLLEYRAGIIAVAAAGTDIGMKGADFGLRTARSEEHTSELQTLMRNSYAVVYLKKKKMIELDRTVVAMTKKSRYTNIVMLW